MLSDPPSPPNLKYLHMPLCIEHGYVLHHIMHVSTLFALWIILFPLLLLPYEVGTIAKQYLVVSPIF